MPKTRKTRSEIKAERDLAESCIRDQDFYLDVMAHALADVLTLRVATPEGQNVKERARKALDECGRRLDGSKIGDNVIRIEAGKTVDLDPETLDAIGKVEPGPGSIAAENRTDHTALTPNELSDDAVHALTTAEAPAEAYELNKLMDDVNEDFGDRREDALRSEPMPTVPYGTPHYVWQAHGRWWYSDAEVRAHGPFDTQMQADIRMKLNHHNTAHGYAFQHVIDWDGRINPAMELDGITLTHIDHLRALIGKGTASVSS